MAVTDIAQTITTDMTNQVTDFSVDALNTEGISSGTETEWMNTKWQQQHGYYKTIPELKKAIDALAIWTLGKGYEADDRTSAILDNIKGWGEDTFNSILWNMLVVKKVGGDSFAEIIRNDGGILINLKPLDPASIKTWVDNPTGIVKRYEQVSKLPMGKSKMFKPEKILHLCNDRFADEIHGTSVVDACTKIILARNEAIEDWQKTLHRNVVPVRIIQVDTENTTKIAALKKDYQDAINKGEVLIVPKGNVEISDSNPVLQDSLSTIKYYENFFYQALGIPKIILGGSEEFTEASSKIGYLTFEQIYAREQRELEADLWNQLAIKIKFIKPASLQNELLSDEKKDSEQGAVQPNDTQAGQGQ